MPREAALVTRVRRELDRRGAWTINLHGSVMGTTGLPDFLAVHRGRALLIETKAPGGRLRPRQRLVLAEAKKAGAVVVVAHDLPAVQAALDEIENA